MIPSGVEIFLGLDPIDLRWGFNRLSGIVVEQLGHEPRSGALFVFIGRRKTAMKLLFWDGSGTCLFYKRLDKNLFRVPDVQAPDATCVELSERELDDLLDGIAVEESTPSAKPRRLH